MKKIILLLSIFCISFVFFACANEDTSSLNISYQTEQILLNMGDNYQIDKSLIEGTNGKEFDIMSFDDSIAKVQNFVVIPMSKGITKLRLYLIENNKVYFDIVIEVIASGSAKTARFEHNIVNINLGEEDSLTSLNKIILNEGCTEVPQIEYDNKIIDYNYSSGVVIARAEGQTTVKVIFSKVTATFEVRIINLVYVTMMTVEDMEVFENSEGKLDFQTFPSTANTYKFWTDSQDIFIQSDGSYRSSSVCEATIFYMYYKGLNNGSEVFTFRLSVVPKIKNMTVDIYDGNTIPNNYIKLKTYSLKIGLISGFNSNNFILSSNVTLLGEFTEIDEYYVCDFCFKNSGEQVLQVNFWNMLGGVENTISKYVNCEVLDSSNIEVAGKFDGAYELSRNIDGNFHLYLEGNFVPHDIYFVLKISDQYLDDEFEVYRVQDTNRELVSRSFVPTETGEYTFEIEYNGVILETVKVIVDNIY